MSHNKDYSDGNDLGEVKKATCRYIPPGTVYPEEVVAWPGEVTAYMGEGTVFPDDGTAWVESFAINPNDW